MSAGDDVPRNDGDSRLLAVRAVGGMRGTLEGLPSRWFFASCSGCLALLDELRREEVGVEVSEVSMGLLHEETTSPKLGGHPPQGLRRRPAGVVCWSFVRWGSEWAKIGALTPS
jgi:hypothetical protein